MKKILYAILVIAVLLGGIIVALSNMLLEIAVNPDFDRRHDIAFCYQEVYEKHPEMQLWHDTLVAKGNWRDTVLTASDGLHRHALVLEHDSLATGVTVMLHGHNDNAVRMMRYAYLHYEELGRNVILPDHFGHGESEGDHIRFAWLDRLDIAQLWIPAAHNTWPDEDIIVHGLSMGGAMTMYTSGEELADSLRVVGFIEDCGYSSIWDQLAFQLDDGYGLPAFPLLNTADWLCQMKYGWSLHDGETATQLAKCQKPMLFIHGDADAYVPSRMVQDNYAAKTQGYKELWITEGSDHAESIDDHWEEYCQHCREYIDRVEAMNYDQQ